ncbi:E3 ubiquitin-protein ligase parkin [Periophthalmus magnuspinnatus]|uniref:E3 ubiquitin-protein ligase parkin n=1 Tax=Periophthalmus magnuspinnatus TaxID=409849 RepID=UPI00145A06BE|nr:E3 ubiquitin-protein ligase parkin [Periophthalmus magnuspinnatus]
MLVWVCYNQGAPVAVEIEDEAKVCDLKREVGGRLGVQSDRLRVLFAGRELLNGATLRSCDLLEQSTVHVVLPRTNPRPPDQDLNQGPDQDQNQDLNQGPVQAPVQSLNQDYVSLTRVDLSPPEDPESRDQPQELRADEESRGRSSFFVFCKRCGGVREGKLRVCCKTCQQSTLTLTQGPSCWDDVQVPGRIRGVCLSDGCSGGDAEFFFKCASHPTSQDERSVALDLVTLNSRKVPCIACMDVLDVVVVFPCVARHVICLDCFRGYAQTRLNERQFVYHQELGYTLPCPAGCEDSLIKELHHFRIMGQEQYDRYLRFGAEQCLLGLGGLLCPGAGCGAGLVAQGRRVECDVRAGCGLVFCRDCRQDYHQGACPTAEGAGTDAQAPPTQQSFPLDSEASLQARWDRDSLLFIKESTKPCPQCSAPVQKNGGCSHMHCPLCQAEWCWVCALPWSRDCMGNHWFE